MPSPSEPTDQEPGTEWDSTRVLDDRERPHGPPAPVPAPVRAWPSQLLALGSTAVVSAVVALLVIWFWGQPPAIRSDEVATVTVLYEPLEEANTPEGSPVLPPAPAPAEAAPVESGSHGGSGSGGPSYGGTGSGGSASGGSGCGGAGSGGSASSGSGCGGAGCGGSASGGWLRGGGAACGGAGGSRAAIAIVRSGRHHRARRRSGDDQRQGMGCHPTHHRQPSPGPEASSREQGGLRNRGTRRGSGHQPGQGDAAHRAPGGARAAHARVSAQAPKSRSKLPPKILAQQSSSAPISSRMARCAP